LKLIIATVTGAWASMVIWWLCCLL